MGSQDINKSDEYSLPSKKAAAKGKVSAVQIILPFMVIAGIIIVMVVYTYIQRRNVVSNVEQVTNQMAEYVATNISDNIDYAESSIRLAALTISQSMTSEVFENPAGFIGPMVDNTPFGGIEYIRADGMNVVTAGEPFDASNRVYYIEGIKGNTGVWNNYHPKTSKETLMNFYTPLVYQNRIVGVITGYIETTSQLAPLFETKIYGQDMYGVLVDENDMVICSTIQTEYVPDLTLDLFLDGFKASDERKQRVYNTINSAGEKAVSYKDPESEGRICVVKIPRTQWKVAIIIPEKSFNQIIYKNTIDVVITVTVIGLLLVSYAAFIILSSLKRRREMANENVRLEEENRIYDEENRRASAEISEIRDIIASAHMGTWRIELVDGKEPCMYVDETMRMLLGISGQVSTPEKIYTEWFSHIKPEAVESVLKSVDRMQKGFFDENTYLWNHPFMGERYVRCGGTAQKIPGGYSLSGYHYDVDDVVREDQAKVTMLKNALDEKNDYYSTLGTLGSIFNSMHVIDLIKDKVKEYSAENDVKSIVNHEQGAVSMMIQVMDALTVEEYKEAALAFTDLTTLAERMQNKKLISSEFVGKNLGWFDASFISMETDEDGRPTKVIYTTRSVDEEKKQKEKLIRKSQTDELTGLLNRRAYEEDIYENDDVPAEGDFIYVSLDVNGLKVVNDTLGHAAGDELLIGACYCMKKSLGSYGKIYRTGGDEFVAILFCDEQKVKKVFEDFDYTLAGWRGKLVDEISVSYGWISKNEEPEATVRQLGIIADKRMYNAKSNHYRKKGVDRRGQQDAHKALCELYTKILKINISDDSYQIVNMNASEQTQEKGFSEKISEWLKSFGTSGQVHPDDLQEYLRVTDVRYMKEYFAGNKTSLHLFYRRKYGDIFKQVMMEIIPANDYSADNQNLFLYVKDIDK